MNCRFEDDCVKDMKLLDAINASNAVTKSYPIGSIYGIFTYIWLIFMANVGKYIIHGSYGYIDDCMLLARSPMLIHAHV